MADEPVTATFQDPIFSSIAASAPSSMMLLHRDQRIRFINQTAPGLTPEQVFGTLPYDYVPPDQHDAMRACFERVAETREVHTYDNVFTLPDGSRSYWESRVSPVLDDDGDSVTGFVVFSADVTQTRVLSAELDNFFQLSIDLFVVTDFDGVIRRSSPSLARLLGVDTIAGPLVELVSADSAEDTAKALRGLAAGQIEVVELETPIPTSAGPRLLQWTATADANLKRIHAVARDITEQRRLQDHLEHSQKIAAVGQLAGGVAHDFNNLMLAVMVNAEFAEAKAEVPKVREHLAQIVQAAERAAELTRQLLTFGRQTPLSLSEQDINELLRRVLKMLRRLVPASIDIDFVAGHKLAMVQVDPAQIEQVVVNLLLNARDAMPEGGRIQIETENVLVDTRFVELHPWARPGRYVLVRVNDTGRGMTAEVRKRIFEPFFTTKGPGEGTGLGLSTAYGIIEKHEGMMHVYSEVGLGTSFKVYLPVSTEFAADVGDRIEDNVEGGTEVILLAEDEELVRKVVTQILESAGYEVVAMPSGTDAIRALREHPERFAMVLLDMVMPDLSGTETWRRMKAIRKDLPVLFTSGYTEGVQLAGDPTEGHEILNKPYRPTQLLGRVRALLGDQ